MLGKNENIQKLAKTQPVKRQKSSFARKLFRALIFLLTFIIIALAIIVGLGRAYLEANPQIKDDLTTRLSERLGIGISSDELGVRLRWSGPQITLEKLQFSHPETKQEIISFDEAQVVLDVPRYLKTQILGVSTIRLSGANLFLQRRANDEFYFNGNNTNELKDFLNLDTDEDANKDADKSVNFPQGLFTLDRVNFVYQDLISEKEIRIEDLKSTIDNNDQLLEVDISADATDFAEKLEISFSTPNPELHTKLAWQVLLEAEKLQLNEFSDHLKSYQDFLGNKAEVVLQNALTFSNGDSSFKVWMNYADDEIEAMNGTVSFSEMEFSRNDVVQEGLVDDLGFRFAYDHNKELKSFRIDQIEVAGTKSNWPEKNELLIKTLKFPDLNEETSKSRIDRELADSNFPATEPTKELSIEVIDSQVPSEDTETEVELSDDEQAVLAERIKLAEVGFNYINLTDLSPVIESFSVLLANSVKVPNIQWRQINGTLSEFKLNVVNDVNQKDERFNVATAQGRFDKITLFNINKPQSLSGLSGNFEFANNKGKLILDSRGLAYDDLEMFRETINLESLATQFDIVKTPNTWRVQSENFSLENTDFKITSKFDLDLQDNQSPVLDLRAEINPKNLDNIKKYYPANMMGESLLSWLETSVSGGKVETAELVLKGALKDYPFREGNGEYSTKFTVKNLNLDYAPEWPSVLLEEADLSFVNESLLIDVKQAKTMDLDSFPLRGEFKDLANSELDLSINSALDMQKVKTWINASPLKENVGASLSDIDIIGQAQSDLSLKLPLTNIDNLKLKGLISFSNNILNLSALDESITELNGELSFNEDFIFSDALSAIYKGQAIQASLQPLDESTIISLNTTAQLGPFIGETYSKYVSGNSVVDAEIIIGGEQVTGIQDIKVRSNLLGTGLNLPAPFTKTQDSLMPLNLNIEFVKYAQGNQKEQLRLAGNIGNTLIRTRFDSLENDPQADWSLFSLGLVGGDNQDLFALLNLDIPRISVLGNYSHVDFDEWLDFLSNDYSAKTDQALEVGLVEINLKKLDAIGQSFDDIKVVIIPESGAWKANVINAQVEGDISFPRPWNEASLIEADLKRYQLLVPENESGEDIDFDPREIPNLNVSVDEFKLNEMLFGETSLKIKREERGVNIESFKVNNAAFNIDGAGGWYKTNTGETTLISVELNSSNLESTLKQLGYAPAASARSANALIELNWPDNPFADILQTVSGSISFKLLNGDIREVEPGAGRFLALLSIAQLPKRLSLDFRDVFNSGLRYDELSADFSIHQGQAYTNNMLMRGPVADLGVVGRVGLATRDFEQAAVVQADLGSSLPVAGAIAGGLGVGAAMLIFSEIFKNPLKRATQVFYKIDGEWGNPKIERTLPQNLEEIPIAPR